MLPPGIRPFCGLLAAASTAALACLAAPQAAIAAAAPTVGPCPMLPADNVWNTDVSGLPVNRMSGAWLAGSGGPGLHIHPDWGPSGGSVAYGIPWQLVDASHQKVAVSFDYASESDPGPYPLGPDTPIEGGTSSSGDRHALVVDTSACRLYETFDTHYASGASHAGSGAIFDLRSNALRPATWTSADAAGLPILPGLVRLAEVRAGAIRHAIRFTVQRTDRSFIWPARHQAGSAGDPTLPPMGARFRMKSSVDISRFSHDAQVILSAMQHYGLIVADNGSNWYFQGDTDPGWSDGVLSELKSIPAGDFEAVDESSLMIDPNSGQARQGVAAAPAPPPPPPPVHTAPPPAAPPATPAPTLPPTPAATPELAVAPLVSPGPTATGTAPPHRLTTAVAATAPASSRPARPPTALVVLAAVAGIAGAAAAAGSGVMLARRRRSSG
jgi:hypothetical protein